MWLSMLEVCLEAIFISLIGISELVKSDSDYISNATSAGVVGDTFVVGETFVRLRGHNAEECWPRFWILLLSFGPIVVK